MKKAKILVLLSLLGSTGALLAEGGCPADHHPQNTPQMRACIPIPGRKGQEGAARKLTRAMDQMAVAGSPGPIVSCSNLFGDFEVNANVDV
jgi:hypothetical protein